MRTSLGMETGGSGRATRTSRSATPADGPMAGTSTARVTARATTDRVMRALTAALPLAVLLAAAPAAHAQRTVYYQAGAWHAFTDKDAQSAAVCGIATDNPAAPGTLSFTYTIGGDDLTITAAKPSWNIPDGTSVNTSLLIDQGQPWTAQTTGNGTDVAWTIDAASIREFDTEFRNGHTITLSFPSGNEPPWTLSLRGSTAASETLWRCVQDLKDRAAAASAAPSAGPPTQPFSPGSSQANAPAPTGSSANGAPAQTSAPGSSAPTSPGSASSTATSPASTSPAPAPAQNSAPSTGTPGQNSAPASGAPAPTSAPPASGTPAPATKP